MLKSEMISQIEQFSYFKDVSEFEKISLELFKKNEHATLGVIYYFTATWCGPCNMIRPNLLEGNNSGLNKAMHYGKIKLLSIIIEQLLMFFEKASKEELHPNEGSLYGIYNYIIKSNDINFEINQETNDIFESVASGLENNVKNALGENQKKIIIKIAQFLEQNIKIVFLYCDGDLYQDKASIYKVRSVPSFLGVVVTKPTYHRHDNVIVNVDRPSMSGIGSAEGVKACVDDFIKSYYLKIITATVKYAIYVNLLDQLDIIFKK